MGAARLFAQAKINLFLRVYGRDQAGYHKLSTLFQRIDLSDEVVVRVGGRSRSLDVTGSALPTAGLGDPKQNLAYRAAMAYAAHTGWKFPEGFAIELTKNIPVGGGLGGGSANAGAVLRVLDALAPQRMDPDELMQIAASLGADVPFLTSECVRARAIGRGDMFTRDPDGSTTPSANALLVVPSFGISTADAYRWLDEDRPRSPEARGIPTKDVPPVPPTWAGLCRQGNDFEPVVEKRFPELRQIRERLEAMGAVARLSGSGSTVFGIFERDAPNAGELGLDASVIATRTSTRVVQVEVLE